MTSDYGLLLIEVPWIENRLNENDQNIRQKVEYKKQISEYI